MASLIRCAALRRHRRRARAPRHSSTKSSTIAISSTTVPAAIVDLRNPQRRGVVALRDVVEVPRLPRRAARCRRRTAPRAASPRPSATSSSARCAPRAEALEEQRHADVLAALQRVREREEAARRHAVAGVRVGAAQVEVEQAPDDARQHHDQRAHHEKRREVAGGVVESVEPRRIAARRERSTSRGTRRSTFGRRRRPCAAIRRSWCRRPCAGRP